MLPGPPAGACAGAAAEVGAVAVARAEGIVELLGEPIVGGDGEAAEDEAVAVDVALSSDADGSMRLPTNPRPSTPAAPYATHLRLLGMNTPYVLTK